PAMLAEWPVAEAEPQTELETPVDEATHVHELPELDELLPLEPPDEAAEPELEPEEEPEEVAEPEPAAEPTPEPAPDEAVGEPAPAPPAAPADGRTARHRVDPLPPPRSTSTSRPGRRPGGRCRRRRGRTSSDEAHARAAAGRARRARPARRRRRAGGDLRPPHPDADAAARRGQLLGARRLERRHRLRQAHGLRADHPAGDRRRRAACAPVWRQAVHRLRGSPRPHAGDRPRAERTGARVRPHG